MQRLINPDATKKDNLQKLDAFEKENTYNIFKNSISILRGKIKNAEDFSDEMILYKKQIKELYKLKKEYTKYVETYLTQDTNKQILQVYVSIENDIKNNKEISGTHEKISEIINKELDLLKDKILFQEKSARDYVEENISFDDSGIYGTNLENIHISTFLRIFTVEYLDTQNSKDPRTFRNNLDITESEAEQILRNIVKR